MGHRTQGNAISSNLHNPKVNNIKDTMLSTFFKGYFKILFNLQDFISQKKLVNFFTFKLETYNEL